MTDEIPRLEEQIQALTGQLNKLRKDMPTIEVRNYTFTTIDGETSLLDMFGGKDRLLLIPQYGAGLSILHLVGGWVQWIPAAPRIDHVRGARL